MTKKKTTAVQVIERPRPGLGLKLPDGRRFPGASVTTNPLVAVIACMTDEHVADLGDEIAATESYLAKLKAVHDAVKPAPPPPVVVEVVAAPAPAPAPPPAPEPVAERPSGRPDVPATKAAGTWKGGRPNNEKSPTHIAKKMLTADVECNTNTVIKAIRDAGASVASENSLRATISTVRSQVRRDKKPADGQTPLLTRPLFPTLTTKRPGDESEADTKVDEDEELDLRKDVAEAVFKKGLLTSGDIVKMCGVPPNRIEEFMKHPWFEYVMRLGQWRLTPLGKQEGVEY